MAAAAATHLNIYRRNLVIIIPYIVMYVAATAAASCCRVYGKAPLGWQLCYSVPFEDYLYSEYLTSIVMKSHELPDLKPAVHGRVE